MKLHLPKTLLVAVLAACVSQAADVSTQDAIFAGDNTVRTPHIEVDKSITLKENDVYFNSWNSGTGKGVIDILTGGSLSVEKDLYSERGTNISVNGGTLTAANIYMGHHSASGYPGELTMTSGTIAAGSIGSKHTNDVNKVVITGGTLKLTGKDAYTSATSKASILIGGAGSTYVTLQTGENDVTYSYADAKYGNLLIDKDNTNKITINGGHLNGLINNGGNASNIALSGDISVGYDAFTYSTVVGGNSDNNGYRTGAVLDLSGVTVENANFTMLTSNGSSIELIDGRYESAHTDYSTFYIKSGAEAISTVKENGTEASTTIEMANGTGLTVDADIATVKTAEGATSATLTVDNSTLTEGDTSHTITTLTATGATVTVGGTDGLAITNATAEQITANADIDLGGNAHAVNSLVINDGATVTTTRNGDAENGAGFVKAVTINGGGTLKQTGDKLSAFGQGSGKMGSLTIGGGEKEAKLLLTNRNAIHGTTVTLKGNATIGSTAETGAVTDAKENGDYRDKRAILDFVDNNTVSVSGTANKIDAALRLRGGETTFKVDNTEKDGITTEGTLVLNGNIFKADGTKGTLAKSGDGKLTIAASTAEVYNAEVTGGTLEIANGKTLTVGNTMTVGAGTLAMSSENAFAVTGAMTFEDGAKLSYTLSTATADTDPKLSYTLGSAGSFSGLNNLTYTGSTLEGYTAVFSTAGSNLMLDFVKSELTLTETAVTDVVSFADGVMTLKTDTEKAMAYVFGEQLNVTISEDLWKSAIADVEVDKFDITLQNVNGETIAFGENKFTVVFNNQNGTVLSTTTAGTYSIPEPTTATLSLLALAGLAARRRRR